MNNFERIKELNIKEFAEYIRSECIEAVMKGVVLDVQSIVKWLESED